MHIKTLFCVSVVLLLVSCTNNRKQVEVEEKGTPVIDLSSGNIEKVASLPLSEATEKFDIVPKERSALNYFTISSFYLSKENIYLVAYKGELIYTYCYNKQNGNIRFMERLRRNPSNNVTCKFWGKPEKKTILFC